MPNLLEALDKTDWQTFRFDEIAQNISKRVEPGATDLTVYVGLEHLDSGSLHIKRTGTPADVDGTKLLVYKGDVIFGRRRAYQRKAAVATFDGICSAHALVLRAKPDVIEPRLFPFFLHSDAFMHRAVDISVGGLSPTVNWGDLKVEKFQLPPRDQQAQLAELLWAADNVREGYQQVKTSLYNYYSSLSADIFTSLEERYECQISSIGKEVKLVNGSAYNALDWGNEGLPIVRIQNLNGSSDYNYFSGSTKGKVLIDNNDLLFAWSGNRGTSFGPYIWQDGKGVLNQHIFRLDFDEAKLSKPFVFEYLKFLTAEIERHAHGAIGLVHITKGALEKFRLDIPTFEIQKQINRLFERVKSQMLYADAILKQANDLTAQIVNQIFSV